MPYDPLLTTEIDILVLLLVACLAAIALQTKIIERVSLVVQNNTVEELAEQKVISQSVVSSIVRAIERDI